MDDKLCGYNSICFEQGKCWGHLEFVMCKNLSEKTVNKEQVSICSKNGEIVNCYTTEREYREFTERGEIKI